MSLNISNDKIGVWITKADLIRWQNEFHKQGLDAKEEWLKTYFFGRRDMCHEILNEITHETTDTNDSH